MFILGKAKRLKQAKEEAQAEIDGYRKLREDQYQKYEKSVSFHYIINRGRHGHDRIVVGFTTTCAISAYHH